MPSYVFGPFRLDPEGRRLLRAGQPVPLTPKAFDTLIVLVQNHGRLVSKEDLMRALWPDTVVEEANVSQNVFLLRKALGDTPDGVPYIATVPRRGYQFVAEVRPTAGAPVTPATASPPPRSLAVLPFAWLGKETADEYLSLGMTDALITRIGNLRGPVIRPTSAVRRYVDAVVDAVAAGRELGVDLVLEGSVQRSGERVRVTARLLEAATGANVWGERLDFDSTDVFALQDALAERLAGLLAGNLSVEDRQRVARRPTEDREAYVAYVKGRHHWNRRTGDDLQRAARHFEEALARDPAYALAWAGLADCLTLLAAAGYEGAAGEYLRSARDAAARALDLDEGLAEAHTSLALVRFRLDWDWGAADREFRRAIELNPGYASAHHFQALYLAARGRTEESIAAIRRAQELDPLSLTISTAVGRVLHFARRHEAAVAQCQKTLELDPYFAAAHFDLGMAHLETGDTETAIAELQQASALSGGRPVILAVLGHVYGVAGRSDEARQILEGLRRSPADARGFSALPFALVHAGLGEVDLALGCLERAYEEGDGLLVFLKVEPLYDRLRGAAQFEALLARMRL